MLELDGSGAAPLRDEDPRWIGPIPLIGRLGTGGMGRVCLSRRPRGPVRRRQAARSGGGGTLKNAATGGCVTVSAMSGTGVRNEACDQSAAPRWTRS
ncbi:hypothetical protein [Streptomyces violaceorubidus]|uniref:Uncharacterized protein n=1 Tax=Streptomyces violaceorubidus TaxID=284042 RepID=A0ABV1SWI0_9ACTN